MSKKKKTTSRPHDKSKIVVRIEIDHDGVTVVSRNVSADMIGTVLDEARKVIDGNEESL